MTRLPRFRIDLPLRFLAGLGAVALAVRHWSGFPASAVVFIVLVALPLGGILITIDDDLAGGWSNPDGSVRPVWRQSEFWAQIAAYATITSMVLATDVGWRTVNGLMAWLLAAKFAFTTVALGTRQRWYFVGACLAGIAFGTLLVRAG
jgi:hypothetical protein